MINKNIIHYKKILFDGPYKIVQLLLLKYGFFSLQWIRFNHIACHDNFENTWEYFVATVRNFFFASLLMIWSWLNWKGFDILVRHLLITTVSQWFSNILKFNEILKEYISLATKLLGIKRFDPKFLEQHLVGPSKQLHYFSFRKIR